LNSFVHILPAKQLAEVVRKKQSEYSPQSDIDFDCCLAGNRGNRKAKTTQKAVKTRQGNSKYNIRTCGEECVMEYCAGDDNAPLSVSLWPLVMRSPRPAMARSSQT
jgi:hypothetical protein